MPVSSGANFLPLHLRIASALAQATVQDQQTSEGPDISCALKNKDGVAEGGLAQATFRNYPDSRMAVMSITEN